MFSFSVPGLLVESVAIADVVLAWLLFRRPGVAFFTFAPIWRANRYLTTPGVVLWIMGLLTACVGFLMIVLARLGAA
jgi:hypothetical protein